MRGRAFEGVRADLVADAIERLGVDADLPAARDATHDTVATGVELLQDWADEAAQQAYIDVAYDARCDGRSDDEADQAGWRAAGEAAAEAMAAGIERIVRRGAASGRLVAIRARTAARLRRRDIHDLVRAQRCRRVTSRRPRARAREIRRRPARAGRGSPARRSEPEPPLARGRA